MDSLGNDKKAWMPMPMAGGLINCCFEDMDTYFQERGNSTALDAEMPYRHSS